MKRRAFNLGLPQSIEDYRNDDLLLQALEAEVKYASRFFTIVDFIDANLDKDAEVDRELLAGLGNQHWQKAKSIIRKRRQLLEKYGPLPSTLIDEAVHHKDR